MSTRFAFFEVKGLEDIGFDRLSDAVSGNRFNSKSTSGFMVDKRSSNSLESRFVEKVVLTDTLTDPFGNAYSQERIQFNELRFLLRTQRPQLTVWNSNPAFKAFSGRLLELADFRLSISPLAWQPLDVAEKFHSEFQSVVVYAAVPRHRNQRMRATTPGRYKTGLTVWTRCSRNAKPLTVAVEKLKRITATSLVLQKGGELPNMKNRPRG